MRTLIVCALLLSGSGGLFQISAAEPPRGKMIVLNVIETNLIEGINCCNEGVQSGAAYLLGELESRKAVIPLLRLLHQSPSEGVRINAALSLIKIGDGRGVYAVKQNAKFDSSERVRELCRKFYLSYKKQSA